jgi:hypothetical protein
VDQVRLAEADATVDEKRVVGNARIHRDLLGGGTGKVVGAAGHQIVESEIGIQPGLLVSGIGDRSGLGDLGDACFATGFENFGVRALRQLFGDARVMIFGVGK